MSLEADLKVIFNKTNTGDKAAEDIAQAIIDNLKEEILSGLDLQYRGFDQYDTTNGYTPKFTTEDSNNLGSHATIENSVTNGFSVTVLTKGIWYIGCSWAIRANSDAVAITVNDPSLSTLAGISTGSTTVAMSTRSGGATWGATFDLSRTLVLNENDVLRIKTNGETPFTSDVARVTVVFLGGLV